MKRKKENKNNTYLFFIFHMIYHFKKLIIIRIMEIYKNVNGSFFHID